MANIFENPAQIASVAAEIVGQDLSLAGKISRDYEADFSSKGNVVSVRVPGAVASHSKPASDTTTALVASRVEEKTIPVVLSDHVYDLVPLSEEDLSLNLDDFSSRVLAPQARAIRAKIERDVVTALQATPATDLAYDADGPARTFTALRKRLRDNGVADDVPMTAAVGSAVFGDLMDADALDDNGRTRGFDVIESTRLAEDEIVAFVPSAFTLVARAPVVPQGAKHGASVQTDTFTLRWLMNYDDSVAVDRSLVSVLLAVQPMPLAVDREDGTVDLVEHGGAVRVLTGGAA